MAVAIAIHFSHEYSLFYFEQKTVIRACMKLLIVEHLKHYLYVQAYLQPETLDLLESKLRCQISALSGGVAPF